MQQLAVFSTSDAGGIDELTLSGLIRAADVTSIGGVRLDDDTITCLTDGVAGGLACGVACGSACGLACGPVCGHVAQAVAQGPK